MRTDNPRHAMPAAGSCVRSVVVVLEFTIFFFRQTLEFTILYYFAEGVDFSWPGGYFCDLFLEPLSSVENNKMGLPSGGRLV